METETTVEDKELGVAFNGSLHTLDRINGLLVDICVYSVNDHILAYKNNLRELFKETQGFLTKPEFKLAWDKWQEILKFEIVKTDDDTIKFDSKLADLLQTFDFWLRLKLHRHHITMATKKEYLLGMEKIKKKYNL